MSYLYLLVDSEGVGFKIGVSNNPSQRIATLPERIDTAKSVQIKCGEKNSYRVEKVLHLLFRNHSLKKERGDGYTEWFSMDCFEAVQDFIRGQRDLLAWTHFEPIPQLAHKPDAPKTLLISPMPREETAIGQKQKHTRAANFIKYQDNNRAILKGLLDMISYMREKEFLFGRFDSEDDEDGRNDYTVLVMPRNDDALLHLEAILREFKFLKKASVYKDVELVTACFSSLKYSFIELLSFEALEILEFDRPCDERFQSVLENIPFIQEPLLSEVLVEWNLM